MYTTSINELIIGWEGTMCFRYIIIYTLYIHYTIWSPNTAVLNLVMRDPTSLTSHSMLGRHNELV